jgi:predicted flap endonuclease-1-like 5' DNA nuclease
MKPAVLSLALVLLLCAPLARASNYFLEQLRAVASRSEILKLRRAGLRTTDDLVRHGATAAARAALSRRSGVAAARLSQLCALSDLMRLRGVGPDAARVMHAAGCRSVADLQRADPQELADAIKRVNDRTRLSTNPPRAENLVAWIAQAQRLPVVYQPDAVAEPAAGSP